MWDLKKLKSDLYVCRLIWVQVRMSSLLGQDQHHLIICPKPLKSEWDVDFYDAYLNCYDPSIPHELSISLTKCL